jgi:hypothetical protein
MEAIMSELAYIRALLLALLIAIAVGFTDLDDGTVLTVSFFVIS